MRPDSQYFDLFLLIILIISALFIYFYVKIYIYIKRTYNINKSMISLKWYELKIMTEDSDSEKNWQCPCCNTLNRPGKTICEKCSFIILKHNSFD